MADLTVYIETNPVTYPGYSNGWADAQITEGAGGPYTYEWRKINQDGSRTVITDQPIGLCRSLGVGEYEYYIKDSVMEITIPFTIVLHQSLSFNISIYPISAFGKADGKFIGHAEGGTAPYRAEITVNGNPYRTEIVQGPTSPEDNNINIQNLPPGVYTIWLHDSEVPENKCGGTINYNMTSPPFVTLNGTVNPLGVNTTVSFDYGITTEYDETAAFGVVNGVEVIHCSLQLSSGGYGNTSQLLPGTLYHYRIKAVNVNGTAYGEDLTFTTPSSLPIVVTLPVTNVS